MYIVHCVYKHVYAFTCMYFNVYFCIHNNLAILISSTAVQKPPLAPVFLLVRLGQRGKDGLEEAEVHWMGKGKGKAGNVKVWRCLYIYVCFAVLLLGVVPEQGKCDKAV